jgi:hypothetical protein
VKTLGYKVVGTVSQRREGKPHFPSHDGDRRFLGSFAVHRRF